MTRPTCGAPAASRETDEVGRPLPWLRCTGVGWRHTKSVAQRPTIGPRRPPLVYSSLWMGRISKTNGGQAKKAASGLCDTRCMP
jgi:hypothetical protein